MRVRMCGCVFLGTCVFICVCPLIYYVLSATDNTSDNMYSQINIKALSMQLDTIDIREIQKPKNVRYNPILNLY